MNRLIPAPTEKELLGLTPEQFQRFDDACHRTYQSIGGDLPGPRNQATQIEVILDADHLRHYGEDFSKRVEWDKLYKETLGPWVQANYFKPKFRRLMKRWVFPDKYYE